MELIGKDQHSGRCRKEISMGNIDFLLAKGMPLDIDGQSLANSVVRLDIFELSKILACVKAWTLLLE